MAVAVLKEAIQRTVGGAQAVVQRDNLVLFITDIDASKSDTKVSAILKEKVGESHFDIKPMKPTKDGYQVATVKMSRVEARRLIREGRIRIGWVSCRVREKVNLLRCFRCLEFGHHSTSVQGSIYQRRALNAVRRAIKPINVRVDGRPYVKCKTQDHRMDSIQCPHYRGLLDSRISRARKGSFRRPK